MKRILLIINPSAGMGTAEERLYDIILTLAQDGCETTVVPLLPEIGLTSERILGDNAERFDAVACLGGDGTLHHLVGSYITHGLNMPIGYLPAGSTNDFARSIGLPLDIIEGTHCIAKDQVTRLDAGTFNNRHFSYIAAFGAFTKVSYETNQVFKNLLGYAAYIVSALFNVAESVNIRCPMVIEHDGTRKVASYIFGAISNSTSIAGFKVPFENGISMQDGLFEVILIKAPENIIDFTQLIGCLAVGNLDSPFIEILQTNDITFHSSTKAAWTLDGEFGGEPEDVHISVLHQRVPLLLSCDQESSARTE